MKAKALVMVVSLSLLGMSMKQLRRPGVGRFAKNPITAGTIPRQRRPSYHVVPNECALCVGGRLRFRSTCLSRHAGGADAQGLVGGVQQRRPVADGGLPPEIRSGAADRKPDELSQSDRRFRSAEHRKK